MALDNADTPDASRSEAIDAPVCGGAGNSCAAPLRIALVWHSLSSGNLGIGALTLSNIVILSEVAQQEGLDPQFVVIGMEENEATIAAEGHVESVSVTLRSLLSPSGIWARLRTVDCVIDINAGDSFTDAYGAKRFAFLVATKVIAFLLRKPLILAPQTIGPFRSRLARFLAACVLRRSTWIVTRDAVSLALAKELAPAIPATQSIDVSFGMPFQDRSDERGGSRLRVGLNVSGLLFRDAETGSNRFGLSYDYAAFSRALIARLSRIEGIEVHLFCHTISRKNPGDDDRRAADQLCGEFADVIRVPDFAGPKEAKSFISSLDFVIAARMHACIAALSSGTPVLPVAYSRKFSGLFSALGYNHLLPVTGHDVAGAVELAIGALGNRQALTAAAAAIEWGPLLDRYAAVLRQELARVASEAGRERQDGLPPPARTSGPESGDRPD